MQNTIQILDIFLAKYSHDKKDTDPYNISPIEMGSLWIEIIDIKSAVRLLNRDWVNKEGLAHNINRGHR